MWNLVRIPALLALLTALVSLLLQTKRLVLKRQHEQVLKRWKKSNTSTSEVESSTEDESEEDDAAALPPIKKPSHSTCFALGLLVCSIFLTLIACYHSWRQRNLQTHGIDCENEEEAVAKSLACTCRLDENHMHPRFLARAFLGTLVTIGLLLATLCCTCGREELEEDDEEEDDDMADTEAALPTRKDTADTIGLGFSDSKEDFEAEMGAVNGDEDDGTHVVSNRR